MTPEQLDLAVWPIFTRMTQRGIMVDIPTLAALRTDVAAELEAQEAALDMYAGRHLSAYSPQDVAAWLAGEGLSTGRRTKGGAASTDERALSMLKDVHPVPGTVLECRGLNKLLNTFIDPTLEMALKSKDCVVHPRWRLTKVKSGRPSCENPNLLAFPTRDTLGNRVRDAFVARPGFEMIEADYSQIEPRVAAALSQDAELLKVFATGADLYADTARRLFKLDATTYTDKFLKSDPTASRLYRQPSKVIWLACILNGMEAKHLFEELLKYGCGTASAPDHDLAACEDFVRRRFDPYPGLGELVARTAAEGRRNGGWVKTAGGRGRFLPALLIDGHRWPSKQLRAEAERQAFNHLIQGTAQEKMKEGQLRVEAAALNLHPLLQVYDAIVGESPDAAAVAAAMKTAMRTVMEGVPIMAGTSVASSWGGLK
jgi:DNA polymerase I